MASINFAENLKRIREEKGITKAELARRIGVSDVTVGHWEIGKISPRMSKVEMIANILGVTTDDLMFDKSRKLNDTNTVKHSVRIPLIGTICAGDGLLAEQNIEDYIYYPFPEKRQPDYALRVKGDSMCPIIKDGDIVYIRQARWADYSGQIVAVLINDNEDGTLKRMKWSESTNKIQLIPENPEYNTLEVFPNNISVCGVYAGHFRPETNQKVPLES